MCDEKRVRELLDEIRAEFPGFRLLPKQSSRLQRLIGGALGILTLGGQRAYLDHYVTTIGRTIYVNRGWEARSPGDRYLTLCHERVHLRQFRRYGWLPMALGYLLLPLPMGLAYVRARLEWEAYAEGLRAARALYGDSYVRDSDERARVVAQFTGPAYGWMWPFRRCVERWYDDVLG
ncbi:MAG TPA: hypothetical protein VKN99_08865 [Polyangia bacterium]|nr:hypothetical protein [Polyangia bacterium]